MNANDIDKRCEKHVQTKCTFMKTKKNTNKINRKAYFVLSPLIYLIIIAADDDTGNEDDDDDDNNNITGDVEDCIAI